MVNICTTPADFDVVVRNAITGAVLRRSQGTLAPNRGRTLPFSFGVEREVYQKTHGSAAAPRSSLLISFAVRDLETKVPRFVGMLGDTATHEQSGRTLGMSETRQIMKSVLFAIALTAMSVVPHGSRRPIG
jgi:hypothetical protein